MNDLKLGNIFLSNERKYLYSLTPRMINGILSFPLSLSLSPGVSISALHSFFNVQFLYFFSLLPPFHLILFKHFFYVPITVFQIFLFPFNVLLYKNFSRIKNNTHEAPLYQLFMLFSPVSTPYHLTGNICFSTICYY